MGNQMDSGRKTESYGEGFLELFEAHSCPSLPPRLNAPKFMLSRRYLRISPKSNGRGREKYLLTYLDDRSNLYPMDISDKKPRRRGRPPKETAGYSETRESLLRVGVEILTEKGFSATGLDEILRGAGVPKGSFYHFFGSKEAFGAELIERYARYFANKLDRFLLDNTLSPLQRLRAFAVDARSGMARHEYKRGCLVGNLGQEMGTLPESFREQLVAVFRDWQSRVACCFEEAKKLGEIRATPDCQQLAATFWIGWEGAILRAKLEGTPDALDLFIEFFIAGLQK